MTLIPSNLVREIATIASSPRDAVERLKRLEALLDGMAAWTPVAREPEDTSDDEAGHHWRSSRA